jgi:hypothetical protein
MNGTWILLGLIAWGGLGLLLLLIFMRMDAHEDRADNRHQQKQEK